MNYPVLPGISRITHMPEMPEFWEHLIEYARLKSEYGADKEKIQKFIDEIECTIKSVTGKILALPNDRELENREPDDLPSIQALRPHSDRILWTSFNETKYRERLTGALIGRFAGCTLGAPVEFWSVEEMKEWARFIGDIFPPVDYWSEIRDPHRIRYGISRCAEYTRSRIKEVPVDDDITYTILGLLAMEDYGPEPRTDDIGAAWLKYLPYACTAEEVALNNMRKGIPAMKAAESNNPYVQWIGADIRSDPWGYAAPGHPEKAAELAYYDACLTHRRNGIYGEMYFAAVIASAFAVDNFTDALRAGLNEIPKDCLLANDVRWALDAGRTIKDHAEARAAVEEHFGCMSGVHTNLNACLTIFGLMMGENDFTKVISEVTAMGYDNDCTAATAGSIAGAVLGISGIPIHWHTPFKDIVLTYLNNNKTISISGLVDRFTLQAKRVLNIK